MISQRDVRGKNKQNKGVLIKLQPLQLSDVKNKPVIQLAPSSVTFLPTYFDAEPVLTHSYRFIFLTH